MPAEQPDYDLFDELALASERLRRRIVRRLDDPEVAKELRPGMREAQHHLLMASEILVRLAALAKPRTRSGGSSA